MIIWEQSYMYIETEYVFKGKDAKYHFREIIDKHFKKYLKKSLTKSYIIKS